jgi:hypothetical protein
MCNSCAQASEREEFSQCALHTYPISEGTQGDSSYISYCKVAKGVVAQRRCWTWDAVLIRHKQAWRLACTNGLTKCGRLWKFLFRKRYLTSLQSKCPSLSLLSPTRTLPSTLGSNTFIHTRFRHSAFRCSAARKRAAKPATETFVPSVSAAKNTTEPCGMGLEMLSRSSLATIPRSCLISMTSTNRLL